jgi:hypothetical protein
MAVPCSAPAFSITRFRIINHIKGLPLETPGNPAMRMMAISQHSNSIRSLLSIYRNLRELERMVGAIRLDDPEDRDEFLALTAFWVRNREKINLVPVTFAVAEALLCRIVTTVQQKHFYTLLNLYRQQLELVENLMELGIGPDSNGIPDEVLGDGIRIDRIRSAGAG